MGEGLGPSVCSQAEHSASSVTGKADSSLSAHLGFHLRRKCSVCRLTLEGPEITGATPPNWKGRPRLLRRSQCARLDTQMRSPLFLCAQKSGSLSLKDGAELQKAHVIEQT